MTATKITKKPGDGLHGDVTTIRILVDDSGIDAPGFANARNPEKARYRLDWTGYALGASTERSLTSPSRLLSWRNAEGELVGTGSRCPFGGKTERAAKFVESLEAYFGARGFAREQRLDNEGLHHIRYWLHAEHGPYYQFGPLSVGSDGVFRVEATCGMDTIRYEITDHAAAQAMLDDAADEDYLI